MNAILVLAGVGIMTVSAAVLFTALTIGIRHGDRRHLVNAPQSNSDALARRMLVGVRYPAENTEGDEK